MKSKSCRRNEEKAVIDLVGLERCGLNEHDAHIYEFILQLKVIEYFLHLSLTNEENFIHTGSGDTSQPTLWFVQDTLATRQIIVYHILMNINKHTL